MVLLQVRFGTHSETSWIIKWKENAFEENWDADEDTFCILNADAWSAVFIRPWHVWFKQWMGVKYRMVRLFKIWCFVIALVYFKINFNLTLVNSTKSIKLNSSIYQANLHLLGKAFQWHFLTGWKLYLVKYTGYKYNCNCIPSVWWY